MTHEDLCSVNQVMVFVFFLIILEYVIARLRNLSTIRMNDCLHSLSAALITALPRLFVTSLDTAAYSAVYNAMYKSSSSDDQTPVCTWFLVFLATDLGYYWFHRAAHEINLLWSAHQVHHNSEDFNIGVSLRQSLLQQFVSWIFYIPLAFIGVNPSTLKTHLWFSCLYQIWTHTEVVDNLGPLEYIFVTPSHHRVHHGRNPYCIDRNYGGILIIWDRIFGTFVEEQEDNIPVYGLVVERVNHWNPLWSQISHYYYLVERLMSTPGISNKFSVLFYGPSWTVGKQRLGDCSYEKIEYPVTKYDKTLPPVLRLYVIIHFLLVLFVYYQHLEISQSCSSFQTIGVILYILFALTTFGSLFDHKWYGPIMEGVRCITYLLNDSLRTKFDFKVGTEEAASTASSSFIQSIFAISFVSWFIVETMKIDWTGNESKHHKNNTKPLREEKGPKHDLNENTLPQDDFIYLQYTEYTK